MLVLAGSARAEAITVKHRVLIEEVPMDSRSPQHRYCRDCAMGWLWEDTTAWVALVVLAAVVIAVVLLWPS